MKIKNINRQIIKLGTKGGLAMTIPSDWAREHCLEAGHIVRVRAVKDGLHISLEGPKAREKRMSKAMAESSTKGLKMVSEGKGR